MIYDKQPGLKLEIERKFLVKEIPIEFLAGQGQKILQGYIAAGMDKTELRLRKKGDVCSMTVKSGRGLERIETEIVLTKAQFEKLWPLTKGQRIEKLRHEIQFGGFVIELDIYFGPLKNLCTAEVEFSSVEESESFTPPIWVGTEVTKDERYKNKTLAIMGLPDTMDK
jgi:CYTH domain-containing protein